MDHATHLATTGAKQSQPWHADARLSALLTSLRHHRFLIALFGVYAVACVIYTKMFHLEDLSRFTLFGITGVHLLILTMFCFFIFYCFKLQFRDRPNHLLPYAIERLKKDFFTYERFFNAAVAITCFYFLLAIFSNFKRMIPLVIPFHLDTFFYELDKTIHFGMDPWQIIQPILGHPLISFCINFLYNIWLFIIIMVFYWQAFASKDRQLRMQYISTFLMCWVLIGTVAATLLSSAGPCFWEGVVPGENVYAPLMEYLRNANETYPIWALQMQETLYYNYTYRHVALASGITAMPSMHVSISVVMALLGWRINRFTGWTFTIYCGLIMLGSVHLGWHYAVDGYVSVILTIAIWHACGWITRRMIRKDDLQQQSKLQTADIL
jgi:hypothetical protein